MHFKRGRGATNGERLHGAPPSGPAPRPSGAGGGAVSTAAGWLRPRLWRCDQTFGGARQACKTGVRFDHRCAVSATLGKVSTKLGRFRQSWVGCGQSGRNFGQIRGGRARLWDEIALHLQPQRRRAPRARPESWHFFRPACAGHAKSGLSQGRGGQTRKACSVKAAVAPICREPDTKWTTLWLGRVCAWSRR